MLPRDPLVDSFGRPQSYLRVSVTDRCNFSCIYCEPPEGVEWYPKDRILTFEELARVVRLYAEMGVDKVRITGGEPLVRRGIVEFIRMVKAIPGIRDISMTTNASLLDEMAGEIRAAGVQRLNISMDSLRADRFAQIRRRGNLSDVLSGLDRALAVGFPVKLNVVVLRGRNTDEVLDFVKFGIENHLEVRFIEFMPLCGSGWDPQYFEPIREVRERVQESYSMTPLPAEPGRVATEYRLDDHDLDIGFIASLSEPFCSTCNRVRLTAAGRIRPCLFWNIELDLLALIRSGADEDTLADRIRRAVAMKPEGHLIKIDENGMPGPRKGVVMQMLGG